MKTFLPFLLAVLPIFATQAATSYQLPAAPPQASRDGPAEAAVEAFREGRRVAAVEMARPLAEAGDADALFLMGYSMEGKEPAKLSRGQAIDFYYRKAAAAGHAEAQARRLLIPLWSSKEEERTEGRRSLEAAAKESPRAARILGEAWLRGIVDGKPDPAAAEQHWKDAGNRGDADSWILLAKFHDGVFGFSEKTRAAESLVYYQKAAEAGSKNALIPLGALLANSGKEKEGRAWLQKAIESNIDRAWLILGDMEEKSEKGSATAMMWYRKGADAGNSECMLKIASNSADPAESRTWLRKAADAGNSMAAAELGGLMLEDNRENAAACRYLISSAREGIWQAQYRLALHYLEGNGAEPDPVAALAWLTEAMKGGDPEVQYKLATLHEKGIGGPVNYANAGVLYTLACKKGHARAATRIAWMAMEGLGTERDPVQAKAHATIALERGDESAKKILELLEGKLDDPSESKVADVLGSLRASVPVK